jgi:hypothetical protein
MNLKGLFQRLLAPKKSGAPAKGPTELRTVSQYFLVFTNIENSPEYCLETELSVGSESGDIVIEDPSLGGRHATFKLDRGAVTVMDLGSGLGTQISDHVLTKGKPVLLKPDDVLMLGEIQIQLKLHKEVVADSESENEQEGTSNESPEIVDESEEVSQENEEVTPAIDDDSSEIIAAKESPEIKARIQSLRSADKPKPKLLAISGGRTLAANLLPRLIAILIDCCWTLVIWIVLSPFDEFREMLEIVPGFMHDHLLPFLEVILADYGLEEDYQKFLANFLEIVKDAEEQLFLSHLVSLYFTIRILFTAVLGVSLGQWMSGIRAFGNFLSVRIRGVLRESIGVFTWAFIIFDLPTLFSRRSVKELITFSHIISTSKGAMLISWLLFIPVTLICLSLAPLFSGLEEPNEILLSEAIIPKSGKKETVVVEMQTTSSEWFRAQFVLPKDSWKVLPRFSWTQSTKGRSLTPTLAFYHQKGSTIPLVLHGTFRWERLLSIGLAHNPMLQANFPTLWSFVQAHKISGNSSLKFKLSDAQQLTFGAELEEFIKVSFRLSLDSYLEHVLTYGPLLKGPIEFRKELQLLVGKVSEAEWSVARYGKSSMLVYEVPGVKPFDIMIPLEFGDGRLFRVNYASPKERGNAVKLARKELWSRSLWDIPQNPTIEGLPLVIDVIAQTAAGKKVDVINFEKIYGAYFEAATILVQSAETDFGRKPLLQSLKNVVEVLDKLSKQRKISPETHENLSKLRDKLIEMKGHFEAANSSFFQSEVKAP